MGVILYLIIFIVCAIFIYYNREKHWLYLLIVLLVIPPGELIYRYIQYQERCLTESGLAIVQTATDVSGFIYEGRDEKCFSCVAPYLTRYGFAYVDIADNANIGDIADIHYRFTLANTGDPACAAFERRVEHLESDQREARLGLPGGTCIARETVAENETRHTLLKAVRRLPGGDVRRYHKVTDRRTGETLAVSNRYEFAGGALGRFWFAPADPPYGVCPAPDTGRTLDPLDRAGGGPGNLTLILRPKAPPRPRLEDLPGAPPRTKRP